jgi:hypothetical protein
MAALALSSTLNLRGESDRHLPDGMFRSAMGPLERDRLRTVLAQARNAGIEGPVSETLGDPRLVQLVSRRFKVPMPSLDACQRYYRDHLESFRQPERYIGRQIVLGCPKSDALARAEAWARAERLIAILFFDPKMFGDLVATYDSINGGSGSGRIGPVTQGELPPALDIALFGLKPGQIYPAPIVTEQGIHVVVLDRILPGDVVPFTFVHGRISGALRSGLRTAAARRHLARLAARYKSAAAAEPGS